MIRVFVDEKEVIKAFGGVKEFSKNAKTLEVLQFMGIQRDNAKGKLVMEFNDGLPDIKNLGLPEVAVVREVIE